MPPPPHLTIATVRLPDEFWQPPSLRRLPQALLTQSEALAPKRRSQFLAGRWLLAELMHHQFGCAQLPEMGEPVNGRPSFSTSSLPDFNLSHSGQDMMAALAQGCRVGVDIEQSRPRRKLMDLARYSFSEEECLWLTSLPENQQTDGFWRLWTLRESVLKLSAKGVWQMKQIAISPAQRRIHTDFEPQPFCYVQQNSHTLWSVACDTLLTTEQIDVWRIDVDTLAFCVEPTDGLLTFTSCAARDKV
ncbi:hypothetical protein SOASR030_20070 [Leminorella grimontii]|uniref:4'-phosphopantetheinyl transferase domain-containing protein n=1 Tax=Leminorella grimontii TaxID=82981 RepID=A0AAV5N2W8_9GAMM|nr:4'-phosphopantetheinyl transferase superfamily protein [Leminorella grimontii]KFC93410.1 4'-phosphopantetheinyl transferase [Leminorella grimontii ATCC 33999 = DSM 5078]GKX55895.1 hypothetical protein SOASR030_20070 [Leminorella grimontii]VFS54943.1 4'-phosphopantetheinyl transferase psf-1 [Leminorella grimontii]